jgi:hypothetical protein
METSMSNGQGRVLLMMCNADKEYTWSYIKYYIIFFQ